MANQTKEKERNKRATVFMVSNQKGGVGKSTTVMEASRSIYEIDPSAKILVVDTDPQANASDRSVPSNHFNYTEIYYNIENFLAGQCKFKEAILTRDDLEDVDKNNTDYLKYFDIVMATNNLLNADAVLDPKSSSLILKNGIDAIRNEYDFIIIDTAPGHAVLQSMAMSSADYIIIVCDADMSSFQNLGILNDRINQIKQTTNLGLKIAGILLTRFNTRTKFNRKVLEMANVIAGYMQTELFSTYINESIAVKEVRAAKTFLLDYDRRKTVTQDYLNFAKELLQKTSGGK